MGRTEQGYLRATPGGADAVQLLLACPHLACIDLDKGGIGVYPKSVAVAAILLFSAATEIEASTQITITPTDMTGLRSLGSLFVLSFEAVKKVGNLEDRTVAHFYVGGLPEALPNASLSIPVDNIDPGTPGGIFEVYSFVGDGMVSTDEWDAGTLFHAFAGLPGERLTLSVDITELLQSAIENGDSYLSFNFRAGNSDRYWLSDIVGLPEPSITIVLPSSRHDCMKEGWKSFGFENQGQCIQFVNTGK
jgi:hypothetical protein